MSTPMLAIVGGVVGFCFAIVFIAITLWYFAWGADKNISLTNVQIILWTGVIAGTYVAMAILNKGFLGDINSNLLELMGISAGSTVTATAIRTVQQPKIIKRKADEPAPRTKGLLTSEKEPDELSIAKFQMLLWTIVTLLIFAIVAANNLANNKPELPDIGSGLLVLMGISHSAYLGNKVADKPKQS